MNETKLEALLKANDVLRADRICAPQRLVKVLAVPTAKLRGAMVNVIERTTAFENPFQLAKLAHVAARVKRHFDVGAQAETNLIRLMVKIARDNVVAAITKLRDEPGSNSSKSAGNEDSHHLRRASIHPAQSSGSRIELFSFKR